MRNSKSRCCAARTSYTHRFDKAAGCKRDSPSAASNSVFAQNMSNLPIITNVEIVPKKEHERENPANYFGPPMMSREEIKRQQSQPRFYAGAQGKYELPEAPSIDEIVRQATGARHQKLREPEPRSDTPDSDISFRSQKSPMPEENLSVDQGKINERKSNLDVNANEETNVLE